MDDPLELDDLAEPLKGGDLPGELVKMLGGSEDFSETDLGVLDDLAIYIESYRGAIQEKEIRPKKLIDTAKDIERLSRELAERIETFSSMLDEVPPAANAPEVSGYFYYGMNEGSRHEIANRLDEYASFMAGLQVELKKNLGPDPGGRRGIASRVLGSPKKRFVVGLAEVWSHFKGLPKATVEGDFYRFVCEAHEFATREEACSFEREIKDVVPKFVRRLKCSYAVEDKIEKLNLRIKVAENDARIAQFDGRDESRDESKRKAEILLSRKIRLIQWRGLAIFPRRH